MLVDCSVQSTCVSNYWSLKLWWIIAIYLSSMAALWVCFLFTLCFERQVDKGILVTHGNGQCPLNKDWTVHSNRSPVMVQSWIWTWDSIKSNFKRIFSFNLYKKPTSNFKINSTSKIYSTPFIRTFAKWMLTFQQWLTNQKASPNCCST